MSIPSLTSPAMLAVQQKVSALMKQGMPAGQIGQVLQQEVLPTGSVPIAQLWQLMNYVKANSQKTQAPPPDSVALQLADQVQQIARQKMNPMAAPQVGAPPTQQMSPPVGASGPPAGPPPGVAGLPSNIAQPQAMAGGGIVAFQHGGDIESPYGDMAGDIGGAFSNLWSGIGSGFDTSHLAEGMTRKQLEEYARANSLNEPSGMGGGAAAPPAAAAPQADPQASDLNSWDAYMMQGKPPQYGAQFAGHEGPPQPPEQKAAPLDVGPDQTGYGGGITMRGGIGGLPKSEDIPLPDTHDLDWHVDQAKAAAEKLGIGAAYKLANDYADSESAKMAHDEKLDRGLALANAGFAMAQAASRGGATFMGSAAEGGLVWAKKIGDARERQDLAEERIEALKIKAAEAADSNKVGILRDSYTGMQEEVRERNAAIRARAQVGVEHERAIAELQAAMIHAEAYRSASGQNDQVMRAMQKEFAKNPTENNPILGVMGKYAAAKSGTAQASMGKTDASIAAAQSAAIANFQKNNPTLMMGLQHEKDPDKLKVLKDQYDAGVKEVLAPFTMLGGGGGGNQFDTTYANFFGGG